MSFRYLDENDRDELEGLFEFVESNAIHMDWWPPIRQEVRDHFFDFEWMRFVGNFEEERLVAVAGLFLHPFVFDHDCREGICGMCSLYINGTPHGKTERGATTCQLYMRRFNDGDVITVEPWRSAAFPVIKDCMVDRNAFDKIIQAGGYTTVRTGQAQDANAILIPKEDADEAMDCASCIGCGACVAACKNGSAMLFVSSKVSQLALLPQGRVEAAKRAKAMVMRMEELGFGNCTNTRACEAVCPKNETIANIARLNREFIKAKLAD